MSDKVVVFESGIIKKDGTIQKGIKGEIINETIKEVPVPVIKLEDGREVSDVHFMRESEYKKLLLSIGDPSNLEIEDNLCPVCRSVVIEEKEGIDIGVYTTEEKIFHKIGMNGLDAFVYWDLHNPPKDVDRFGVRRVYFACKRDNNYRGYWVGYFNCHAIDDEKTLCLHDWHQIDPDEYPCEQFQGFTYNVPEAD